MLVAGSALLTSGFRIGGPRLQVTCAAADALALAAVLPAIPVLAVYVLNGTIWMLIGAAPALPVLLGIALYEALKPETPPRIPELSLGHLLESNATSPAAVSEHPAEPIR